VTTPTEPGQPGEPTPGGYGTPPGGYGPPEGGQYGAPGGYGSMPPAPEAYGAPAPGGMPQLANWGERVLAGLIDFFILYFLSVILSLSRQQGLANIAFGLAVIWGLINAYQQGATGQSTGKKIVGIRTLREQDGQPLGGGVGLGRGLLHILDLLPCGLGFLWPLWDSKNQTWADKIVKSVVVKG
jgi:uncharacterized RDD family membrane protein YckC